MLRESRQTVLSDICESQAIGLACEGDSYAFNLLYKSHSRRVYGLCIRLTGNRTEAEDLTQEAFLQLFRKIHTFRGESKFSTWLHTGESGEARASGQHHRELQNGSHHAPVDANRGAVRRRGEGTA